jgi:hypothetical protein
MMIQRLVHGLDGVQIGPQYGGNIQGNPMTGISDFVQQAHNFIARA